MGDPNKSTTSPLLPPGCRFYPSEEEIFQHYLRAKNDPTSFQEPNGCDVIKEIDIYNFSPFDLPDVACFSFGYRGRKRHLYCYGKRTDGSGERSLRRVAFGYWKRKGRIRDVMGKRGGREVVLGKRASFVYYSVNGGSSLVNHSKQGVRSDWFMYEYALIDNLKAPFVLCRIFLKSRGQNYLSENALSSCAEESAATVRHIGIQHDGGIMSGIGEDGIHYLNKNKKGFVGESFQIPSDVQSNKLRRSSEVAGDKAILEDALDAPHLTYILEEDFIELDDLV